MGFWGGYHLDIIRVYFSYYLWCGSFLYLRFMISMGIGMIVTWFKFSLEFKENDKVGIKGRFHSFIKNLWYNTYCLRYISKEWITRKKDKKNDIFWILFTFWSSNWLFGQSLTFGQPLTIYSIFTPEFS